MNSKHFYTFFLANKIDRLCRYKNRKSNLITITFYSVPQNHLDYSAETS